MQWVLRIGVAVAHAAAPPISPDEFEKLTAYSRSLPALEVIYRFKQRLCYLLLKKHRTRKQCHAGFVEGELPPIVG